MWSKAYGLHDRPPLPSKTPRIKMPCGETLYITVSFLDKEHPIEVFINIDSPDEGLFNILRILREDVTTVELDILGKIAYCNKSYIEAIGRLASNWLRDGADPKKVGKTLSNIRCAAAAPGKGTYLSCADAVGKLLYTGDWYSGSSVELPADDTGKSGSTLPFGEAVDI